MVRPHSLSLAPWAARYGFNQQKWSNWAIRPLQLYAHLISMAARRLISVARCRAPSLVSCLRAGQGSSFSSVPMEAVVRKVDVGITVLTENPRGDKAQDLNRFFEIPGAHEPASLRQAVELLRVELAKGRGFRACSAVGARLDVTHTEGCKNRSTNSRQQPGTHACPLTRLLFSPSFPPPVLHSLACLFSMRLGSEDAFAQSFPRGVSDRKLDELFQRLTRKRLLVRQASLDVIGALEAVADGDEKAPNLVVLSSTGQAKGPKDTEAPWGTGKTATLVHAVHWARSSGWVVVHVPSCRHVMTGGYWVQPSPDVEGDFDQPQVHFSSQAGQQQSSQRFVWCNRFSCALAFFLSFAIPFLSCILSPFPLS